MKFNFDLVSSRKCLLWYNRLTYYVDTISSDNILLQDFNATSFNIIHGIRGSELFSTSFVRCSAYQDPRAIPVVEDRQKVARVSCEK